MFASTSSQEISNFPVGSMPTTSQNVENVRRRPASNEKYQKLLQNQRCPAKQRIQLSSNFGQCSLQLLLPIFAFAILIRTTSSRNVVPAKCYFFGPGTTIHGADYRQEYDVTRKECAEQCKQDSCCMGFKWLNGLCTFKSRSLNGTITSEDDAYFGLCLDFEVEDRDRFWDHELGGSVVQSKEKVDQESCMKMCGYHKEAIIYSWKAHDERNSDDLGDCNCIAVLHSIRLNFGSSSGFLI